MSRFSEPGTARVRVSSNTRALIRRLTETCGPRGKWSENCASRTNRIHDCNISSLVFLSWEDRILCARFTSLQVFFVVTKNNYYYPEVTFSFFIISLVDCCSTMRSATGSLQLSHLNWLPREFWRIKIVVYSILLLNIWPLLFTSFHKRKQQTPACSLWSYLVCIQVFLSHQVSGLSDN